MKLTKQQINFKISELHEPYPGHEPDSPYGAELSHLGAWQWATLHREWHPVHWATDDGQACKLLDEMPAPCIQQRTDGWWRAWPDYYRAPMVCAKTRPLAICLAWLAMKGIEVEVIEDE
jgi:hypothetical protein